MIVGRQIYEMTLGQCLMVKNFIAMATTDGSKGATLTIKVSRTTCVMLSDAFPDKDTRPVLITQ